MDHELSVKERAAEKYLLGELAPRERQDFEAHFFECPECAEEVRLAFEFRDGAETIFAEPPRHEETAAREKTGIRRLFRIRFVAMLPVAAGLGLVVLTAYQNAVLIPRLRTDLAEVSVPQVVPLAVLVPASRGELPSITVPAAARFIQLSLEVGSAEKFDGYETELLSGAGQSIWKKQVLAPGPDGSMNLLVPAGELRPGSYEVILRGTSGSQIKELDHYRFGIERP